MSLSSDPNTSVIKALELRWSGDIVKDEYEIDKHQICPTVEHKLIYEQLSIDQFMQMTTAESLKNVESLSFISEENNLIDSIHLEKVIELIPLIECISLNNQKFSSNANKLFNEKIGPKILHMSLDDCVFDSTTDLSELFKSCNQLTDFKLTIKSPEFDASCLRELSETLINFYLKDVSIVGTSDSISDFKDYSDFKSHDSESHILNNAMECLRKGKRQNLQFLRIESDEHQDTVVPAFQEISKLSQLRGLNLTTRNYLGPENAFEVEFIHIGKLNKLETLTLKLYDKTEYGDQTEDILKILSESSQFKSTLRRFRLINAEISLKCVEYILNNFKQLESLQFVDSFFLREDMNEILKLFTKFNRLNQLIVENNNSFDSENMDIIDIGFKQIIYLIENCQHLDDLHFVHNINDIELDNLQLSAINKGINFTYINCL